MQVGDRIIANRKIELVNGKVFAAGTTGRVTCTPPHRGTLHVAFNGGDEPCALPASAVRRQGEPPPRMWERFRTWLRS
jgi:hypothetical protein